MDRILAQDLQKFRRQGDGDFLGSFAFVQFQADGTGDAFEIRRSESLLGETKLESGPFRSAPDQAEVPERPPG
jgi:hypothetical protein